MRRRVAILTFICTAVVFSNVPFAAGEPQFNKEASGFVGFANQITDWFTYLSTAYDEIVTKEERNQLIVRVENIATKLYKLETARATFVGSLLRTKNRPLWEDKSVLMEQYNRATREFRIQIVSVSGDLSVFGADLRSRGAEGQEVEKIIRLGVNSDFVYDSVLEDGQVKTYIRPGSYGTIDDVDFNENELREESKRCIEALRAAQLATSQFLEHLKQEADRAQ